MTAHKFKAFAVLDAKRWPKLPDTPTTIEAGAPGVSLPFWHGLWTTKGTPPDIIARLDGAVQAALANPTINGRLTQLGQVIFPADQQNPTALAAYEKAELAKWAPSSRRPASRRSRRALTSLSCPLFPLATARRTFKTVAIADSERTGCPLKPSQQETLQTTTPVRLARLRPDQSSCFTSPYLSAVHFSIRKSTNARTRGLAIFVLT